MFLLVSKFKMIGLLLSVVHCQVQKSQQKHIITKESRWVSKPFHFKNYGLKQQSLSRHTAPLSANRLNKKLVKLMGYHYLTATSYELSHTVCLSFLTLSFCSFEDTLSEKTIIIRNVTSNHHIRPCVTVIRRSFVSISCDFYHK